MAAQLRELRQRIRSTQGLGKIFKAQEVIATTRISRAQARVQAARPYATEITNVLSALAGAASTLDHPLLTERAEPKRAGVLVVTSDRGLCGGYNANVLRAAEELVSLLRNEGKDVVLYLIGRKAVSFYTFRDREFADSWTGFSETPRYENAQTAGEMLVRAFMQGEDDAADHGGADGVMGVDELHIVYTEFRSMLTQVPVAKRIAPLEVEYSEEEPATVPPSYEFEPGADQLLGALLPKYINTRIFAALLDAAASESAARRTAMKSASDNARDLVLALSREANQARQAQITQEISEIVGGANALAAAGSDD
jgi:F-type H+-transporting ATPase subunit gamma